MSVGDIAIIVVFLVFFAVLCVWTYRDFIQKINKDINDIKELNLELSVFNHENAEQSFQEIDRIFNKSNICVSSWEGYSSAMIMGIFSGRAQGCLGLHSAGFGIWCWL